MVAAGCGKTRVETRTVTRAVTVQAPPPGVQAAVERTRRAIQAAAANHDYAALAKLVPSDLRYSFGGPEPGGAIGYWKRLEASSTQRPLETLAAILKMPYVLSHGIFFWPFAYATPPAELTPYEKQVLAPIAGPKDIEGWVKFGGYIGWRAGIAPDGRWQLYVAGD
jgi:hypothetical protein